MGILRYLAQTVRYIKKFFLNLFPLALVDFLELIYSLRYALHFPAHLYKYLRLNFSLLNVCNLSGSTF